MGQRGPPWGKVWHLGSLLKRYQQDQQLRLGSGTVEISLSGTVEISFSGTVEISLSGTVEISLLLGFCAVSLGELCLTFRERVSDTSKGETSNEQPFFEHSKFCF